MPTFGNRGTAPAAALVQMLTGAVVVLLATVAGVGETPPSGVQPLARYTATLGHPIPGLDEIRKTFVEALLDIAYRYRVPFALEYVDRGAATKPLGFVVSRATVRTAIKALVRSRPEYSVTFSGGIVDVYSPRARADRSNFLNTEIPRFDSPSADLALVGGMLYGAVLNTIGPPTGFGGSFAGTGGPQVAIHARGLKVFEILNRLVAQQGRSIWVVSVAPTGLSRLGGELWHIYPLDPALEPVVVERLQGLFPPNPPGKRE